jgi:spermidine/putrescine transport system substrate-binding protein
MTSMVQAAEPQELVILTWSEYMDPELVQQFESQNNAIIKFVYFESDELRDDMLVNADGAGFDIICSNGRSIKTYAKRGWLEPIGARQLPNRKHIDPRWLNAFPHASEYAVPFFWGTEGIAYRKDLVKTPITSWKQILKPAAELQGKIVLVKDARGLMMMALKSLGQSINTSDRKILKQAEELLLAQKPHVKDYSYVALTEESALVKGTALAALAYSGDALALAEHDENIAYVVPQEGTALWVDYLVVSKASKHKKLAMDFLNYINEPKVAAQLAEFVYYASPNQAAEKHLPEDFLNDPVIYPDKSIIDRGEFYLELPPRTQRSYNNILPQIVGE